MIETIALGGVAGVKSLALEEAIHTSFRGRQGQRAVESAEQAFSQLAGQEHSREVLRRFVNGWGATHGTASHVSALIARLLLHSSPSAPSGVSMLGVTKHLAAVVEEDLGLCGTPHAELYERFGSLLTCGDQWKERVYEIPECAAFRRSMLARRTKDDPEDAILFTAAAECWNAGEYTYVLPLLRQWLLLTLRDPRQVENGLEYVAVHAGETEAGHCVHAVTAWQAYCQVIGRPVSTERLVTVFDRYFEDLARAYDGIIAAFR